MPKNSDRVPIPPKETMNRNLSAARVETMLSVLGKPGPLTKECSDPAGPFAQRVIRRDVGPFDVEGLDIAVESLDRIFAEVRAALPDVFKEARTEGMLCVRARRHNPTVFSNHSWGCAIDLFFGVGVVEQGDPVAHRGNLLLLPFFNEHGWYWGAEFSGSSVDSMHFELAEETILKLGRDAVGVVGTSPAERRDIPPAGVLRSGLLRSEPVLMQIAAGERILRRSDIRQHGVGTLQDALNQLARENPALAIDVGTNGRSRGIFGPKTEAAVRAFQAAQHLSVDGVVGSDTVTALDDALGQHA
jgi:hypothetical protein